MGLCSCFGAQPDADVASNSECLMEEPGTGSLARLVSSRLSSFPATEVHALASARVNVGAASHTVSPAEPWQEPLTARVYSRAQPTHAKDAREIQEQLDWTASRWDLDNTLRRETEAAGGRHAAWETGLYQAESELRTRLRAMGLDLHIMLGDGNCQFRSVAHSIYGTQAEHAKVRAAATDYMAAHPDEFRAFLGPEFESYLESMRQSGVWGDELTLRAISNALCVTISVLIGARQMVRYIPDDYKPRATPEIFLTYISPVHYNAIQRIRRQTSPSLDSLRRRSRIARAIEDFHEQQAH